MAPIKLYGFQALRSDIFNIIYVLQSHCILVSVAPPATTRVDSESARRVSYLSSAASLRHKPFASRTRFLKFPDWIFFVKATDSAACPAGAASHYYKVLHLNNKARVGVLIFWVKRVFVRLTTARGRAWALLPSAIWSCPPKSLKA